MPRRLIPLILVASGILIAGTGRVSAQNRPAPYYPSRDTWERKAPADVGMNAAKLQKAIEFAESQESSAPRDFSDQVRKFGRLLGPMPAERGGTNGLVVRHGYIVAEFGDTTRAEPTYSVAKSFLSTLLGIAIDRGLIGKVDDPVGKIIHDGGYDSPHNARITWEHHARQTSEWEGEMFGKSHDFVGQVEFGEAERKSRPLREPGSYYEYNDVRINRFSLALLTVFKQPLPQVLKEAVMDPIGASDTWKYHGYGNSDVMIEGQSIPSVSGGTRWGGGLWINSRDEARFGLLFLREGEWQGKQLVSRQWVEQATRPGEVGPDYGYLWWLNTTGKSMPDAPRSSFCARGNGANTIYVDPEHDLVIVWRWHAGGGNEFFKRVIAAIEPGSK